MPRRLATLVALGLLTLLPVRAVAETLVLKNDTPVPIIVQATIVVRGRVLRDRPVQIQPGDSANINLPGNKLITVADAKTLKPVHTQTVPGAATDQEYSIQVDGANKVHLEPVKPK